MTKPYGFYDVGQKPGDGEPDYLVFEEHGFLCMMMRNRMRAWCGYVGLHEGHPLHGVNYDDSIRVKRS